MQEQRLKPRVVIREDVTIEDVGAGLRLGKLVNLSDEGFLLLSQTNIQAQNVYQLMLSSEAERPSFSLGAECVWVNNTGNAGIWAGFRIIDISKEAERQLKHLQADSQVSLNKSKR